MPPQNWSLHLIRWSKCDLTEVGCHAVIDLLLYWEESAQDKLRPCRKEHFGDIPWNHTLVSAALCHLTVVSCSLLTKAYVFASALHSDDFLTSLGRDTRPPSLWDFSIPPYKEDLYQRLYAPLADWDFSSQTRQWSQSAASFLTGVISIRSPWKLWQRYLLAALCVLIDSSTEKFWTASSLRTMHKLCAQLAGHSLHESGCMVRHEEGHEFDRPSWSRILRCPCSTNLKLRHQQSRHKAAQTIV